MQKSPTTKLGEYGTTVTRYLSYVANRFTKSFEWEGTSSTCPAEQLVLLD